MHWLLCHSALVRTPRALTLCFEFDRPLAADGIEWAHPHRTDLRDLLTEQSLLHLGLRPARILAEWRLSS
jgi:hypothetical protein